MSSKRSGDTDEPGLPAPAGDVAASKLGVYATGHHRKSKLEKEREAALLKQQQAEQDAAKAYEDFVASFDADVDDRNATNGAQQQQHQRSARASGKAFVRAGAAAAGPSTLYNPMKKAEELQKAAAASVAAPAAPAIPTAPRAMRSPAAMPTAPSAAAGAFLQDDDDDGASKVPVNRKKRDMDNFLEQLKRLFHLSVERSAACLSWSSRAKSNRSPWLLMFAVDKKH
ncbi:hypothetical protein OIV83_001194 [Microbotryomycetes sp. JL201]|nr:hypothetical protein OIV83_001194 [Microbotryomycetes sp. JL201]